MEHIGSCQKLMEGYGSLWKLMRAYGGLNGNFIETLKQNWLMLMCSKYILRILSLWEIIQTRSSRSRSLQNNTAQITPVNFNPVMECHLIHWILHPEMEVSRSSWNIFEASGIIWKLEWFNWHHKIANLKREKTHT